MAVALVALSVCATGGGQLVANDYLPDLISEADEARIGAEQHDQILAEFGGAYDDPKIAAYVDSIGQFLALTSERPNVKFTFTVLNSPIVNAFALPGGYIYVSRGLLALAGDEAELAGVIAHEIGHVAARHGAQRMSSGIMAQLGLGLLSILTDSPELSGIAQLGAMAAIQGYSRDQEFEADMLGVHYLERAGFDTEAMASFLAKMRAYSEVEGRIAGHSGSGDQFDIFATHPRTAERVRRAVQAANVSRVAQPIVGREIYLNKINGMLFGDDPGQGVVRGRQFLHPDLGFRFEAPPDFSLLNGQTQVLGRGPDGAILVFDADSRPDGRPMTGYLQDIWAEGTPVRELQRFYVDNREAATAMVRLDLNGQPADARLIAIGFDSTVIYRFVFLTPTTVTAHFYPLFRETVYSFRGLSASEADAIRPHRLVLHWVRGGETSAQIASRMPSDRYALARFLVLNGLYPNQALGQGWVLKTVVE